MTFLIDQNLLPEFESIKDKNEKILWTERPRFIPFIFSNFWGGLITVLFVIIWVAFATNSKSENGNSNSWGIWFGLLPLALLVLGFAKKLLSFNNTCYAYSDKRVMMRSGFFGTSFKVIDYDKISDIEVTVNFIERVYNVGTIQFFSGRTQTDEGNTTKLYDYWGNSRSLRSV